MHVEAGWAVLLKSETSCSAEKTVLMKVRVDIAYAAANG